MLDEELMPTRRATRADLWELWWLTHKAVIEGLTDQPKAYQIEMARNWLRQNGVVRKPNDPKSLNEHLDGLSFPLDL